MIENEESCVEDSETDGGKETTDGVIADVLETTSITTATTTVPETISTTTERTTVPETTSSTTEATTVPEDLYSDFKLVDVNIDELEATYSSSAYDIRSLSDCRNFALGKFGNAIK